MEGEHDNGRAGKVPCDNQFGYSSSCWTSLGVVVAIVGVYVGLRWSADSTVDSVNDSVSDAERIEFGIRIARNSGHCGGCSGSHGFCALGPAFSGTSGMYLS